ncbi:MAG: hypothetical protein HMLKMBBP_03593 [Planctomycetes bacterium]|nr:hypothetical protein [Planctomycetota bacterium]
MRRTAPALIVFAMVLPAACGQAPSAAPNEPGPPAAAPDAPRAPLTEAQFLAELDRSRGTKDCFDVIRDPAFLPADGPHGVRDDDRVLCFDAAPFAASGAPGASGPLQACYPTALLDFHEIVEHTMAGLELLACW